MSMYQLIIKKKMLPLRQVRYCCAVMKERGGMGRVKITGVRAEESHRRAKRPQIDPDHRHGSKLVHVIHRWTTADVWQYIRENNLPYCKLYDEGFTRLGCVLCPFATAKNIATDIERFPAIVAMYKRACDKLFALYHGGKHPEWTCGDDMFNWWIERHKKITIAEGCNSVPLFSDDDGTVL